MVEGLTLYQARLAIRPHNCNAYFQRCHPRGHNDRKSDTEVAAPLSPFRCDAAGYTGGTTLVVDAGWSSGSSSGS